jgi:hypothetical protein
MVWINFTLFNNHSDISHENQKKLITLIRIRILHVTLVQTRIRNNISLRCGSCDTYPDVQNRFNQCCGSKMFIPILDPEIYFFVAKIITKINIILFLNRYRYIWAYSKGITELFSKKIVAKLSETWVWDPGSEFRDCKNSILDPGSRGQKSTGSRIRTRNSDLHHPQQQCNITLTFFKRSVTTVQTVSFSNFYKMACPQLHPWNVRCLGWW